VPLHIFAPGAKLALDARVAKPGLANLASTVLYLMGYEAPADYLPGLVTRQRA
jgi:hypothetical protein